MNTYLQTARPGRKLLAATAALALLPAIAAAASEVTIRVKGGGLEITGEVRAFDGEKYVIESPAIGLMTFNVQRIECVGEACGRRVAAPVPLADRLNPAAPDTVLIAGASAAATGLMPAMIRGYAASIGATATQVVGGPDGELRVRLANAEGAELATFRLKSQDSGAALDALGRQSATIGLSERVIADAEALRLFGADKKIARADNEHLLATDGLTLIVAPANPAIALTEDEVARIFSGQVDDWFHLGAKNAPITVYTTDRAGGAIAALEAQILKPRGLALGAAIKELASDSEVADMVARDPGAIGLTSFSASSNARRVNIAGACGLIARPSAFAVKAGEYALSRPLYLYTAGQPAEPAARGLIRYALSKPAQALVTDADFIDRSVGELAADEQKERMAHALNAPPAAFDMELMRQLLSDIKGARRLSLTFRFTRGTIDFDARSRRQIAQLAELLQTPELAGKNVTLIGFSDAETKLSLMTAFAAKRAAQVRQAVLAAAGPGARAFAANLHTRGYGPIAPLVCNDTPEHRQLNRRVEVWIKD